MENHYRLAAVLSDLHRPTALVPVSLVLLERSICENGKVQLVTIAEDAHRIALADVLERNEGGLESVVLRVVAVDLNQRVLVAEGCSGSDRCITHNFSPFFLKKKQLRFCRNHRRPERATACVHYPNAYESGRYRPHK